MTTRGIQPRSRMLTTSTSNAISKVRFAVEQYRMQNYSEELPSRCKKEIIYAAANAESHRTGKITIEGFNKILQNIGASNVSKSDVQLIVDELGEDSDSQSEHTIQVAKMLQIL